MINYKVPVSFCITFLLTVTGCASLTIAPVSDENRTTSKEFDGAYSFPATNMADKQYAAGGVYNCRGKSRALSAVVRDGVLTGYYQTDSITTNVNSEGRFHLIVPTEFSYTQLGNSTPGSEINYVYSGQLGDPGKATFTIGKKSENNLGCSTTVAVEKK